MISETVSEKRPRGRPKAWHHDPAVDLLSGSTTERGRANFRLAVSALVTLSNAWQPEFAWFWNQPPTATFTEIETRVMDRVARQRSGALTELGRIPGEQLRLEVARAVASLPTDTTTREAAVRIRHLHDLAALRCAQAGRVEG